MSSKLHLKLPRDGVMWGREWVRPAQGLAGLRGAGGAPKLWCLWQALNHHILGTDSVLAQPAKLPLIRITEGTRVLRSHQVNGKCHSKPQTSVGRSPGGRYIMENRSLGWQPKLGERPCCPCLVLPCPWERSRLTLNPRFFLDIYFNPKHFWEM